MAAYTLPGIFVMGCLVYLMESYVIRCPEQAEWNIRADIRCQNTTTYFCLYDYIAYSYEEGCTGPDWDRSGSKRVYSRNFNRAPCNDTRYQPIKFVTNGSSDCIFRKSLCTDEGQILFSNGTTRTDSTCRCDYTQGYAFVTVPRSKCYCQPSEEDCSCYLKKCQGIGYNLSPDYECTKDITNNTDCPSMSANPSEDPHIDMALTGTPTEYDSYAIKRTYDVAIIVSICLFVMIVIAMYIMLQQRLPRCPCLSTEQGKPTIKIVGPDKSVNLWNSVTLQCVVIATPSATSVQWNKITNGVSNRIYVAANPTKYSGASTNTPSLTIYIAANSDQSFYTCQATNAAGTTVSSQTFLTVVGNLPIVTVTSGQQSIIVGNPVTLGRSVQANPMHTTVVWRKMMNGVATDLPANSRYSGSTVSNPSLSITSVQFGDIGKYVCYATNSVGTGQSTQTFLNVVGSVPVVNVESTSYSTNVGNRVTLQCTVTANPPHTLVEWQRVLSNGNTQPIYMTNSRYSGVALGSPSLIIDNTRKTDEGKYVCIATNLVGSGQSQQTYLTVVGSTPTVTVNPTHSVNRGSAITLECLYSANPPATQVRWQKENVDLGDTAGNAKYGGSTTTSASLIIYNAAESDEGTYVCTVTNNVGTGISTTTTLDVVGNGNRLKEIVSENNGYIQIVLSSENQKSAVDELKGNIDKEGTDAVLKHLNEDLNHWRNEPVKLAVTGKSGVGKSSFINAIRNLKPGDSYFATSSGSGNTTEQATVYKYPGNPKITLHDLPAFGTTNLPTNDYVKTMKLHKYDYILIFVGNIEENDLEIANKLKEMEKPFCFVRSKIDLDILNAKNDGESEKDAVEKIILKSLHNLEYAKLSEAKFFVISNHNRKIYEFNDLVSYIQRNLPALKCDVVMFSLSGEFTDDVIDNKYQLLKNRLLKVSVVSVDLNTGPISCMDKLLNIELIVQELWLYHKTYGFEQQSVKDILKVDYIRKKLNANSIIEIQAAETMREFVNIELRKLRKSETRGPHTQSIHSVMVMWPGGEMTFTLLTRILDGCRDDAKLVYSHMINVDV